jgi:hypothetical protein
MPSTPYARLRIRVNGGAPQTGAVTIAAGDTIQLDAESYDGWGAPVARWEWYSYPDGWTGPGGSWSSEVVTQSDGTTATVYYWNGNSAPPSFTAPAIGTWGKFLPKLTVLDGYKGGAPSTDVVDTSTAMEMVSSLGLKDLAHLEGKQFGEWKKWARDHQANLRTLNTLIAAIGPYTSTPAAVTQGTGSAGASSLFSRGDHSHQLTFATLNAILNTANAGISINGQTLTAGGFIGAYYSTSGTPKATSGLLRATNSENIIVARNDADDANVPLFLWGMTNADELVVGNSTYATVKISVRATSYVELTEDGDPMHTFSRGGGMVFHNLSTFNISHDTAVAAGADATISAQGGAATFNGGKITISAGEPGAGGNPQGIDLQLKSGATYSGALYVKGGAYGNLAVVQYLVATTETVLALGPTKARINVGDELQLDPQNLSLFEPGSFGGGEGVVCIGNAAVPPTTAPSEGVNIWADDHALIGIGQGAVKKKLVPAISAGTATALWAADQVTSKTSTANATPAVSLTYPIADGTVAFVKAKVVALGPTGDASVFEIRGGVKRSGGGATLIGSPEVFAREDDALTDANITVSGNNVQVEVTGIALTTINWFTSLEVTLMTP